MSQIKNSTESNASDSDSYDGIENVLSENVKKVYQLQCSDSPNNLFKFRYMGMFESMPTVALGNFSFDDDTKNCTISSEFVDKNELDANNTVNMIKLTVINKDKITEVYLGTDFETTDFKTETDIENKEFRGNLVIYYKNQQNEKIYLKKNLNYPGNNKIIPHILQELNNEKLHDVL
jgi:hypothetical protein